jgi:hypothetical protein
MVEGYLSLIEDINITKALYYLGKRLGVMLSYSSQMHRICKIRYARLRQTVTSTPPAATEIIVRRLDLSITGLPRHAVLADTVASTGEHGDFR